MLASNREKLVSHEFSMSPTCDLFTDATNGNMTVTGSPWLDAATSNRPYIAVIGSTLSLKWGSLTLGLSDRYCVEGSTTIFTRMALLGGMTMSPTRNRRLSPTFAPLHPEYHWGLVAKIEPGRMMRSSGARGCDELRIMPVAGLTTEIIMVLACSGKEPLFSRKKFFVK